MESWYKYTKFLVETHEYNRHQTISFLSQCSVCSIITTRTLPLPTHTHCLRRTNRHTHTHTYVYIYIYIYTCTVHTNSHTLAIAVHIYQSILTYHFKSKIYLLRLLQITRAPGVHLPQTKPLIRSTAPMISCSPRALSIAMFIFSIRLH